MNAEKRQTALIVGAGPGLSASFARLCAGDGMAVALAARNVDKLGDIAAEIGARVYACDASSPADVERLFGSVVDDFGVPDVVLYNPSSRLRGPLVELAPAAVLESITITCFGGFLVGQAAARLMLDAGGGTILFTGASASVKGYAQSATFAMGKFGLRGLAQSMARELQPQNIHVAHFVIDGGILAEARPECGPDAWLDPDAIASTYMAVHRQHRSAWTWEIEMRPWIEKF